MTVMGAMLGLVCIGFVGRWLLMGGDDDGARYSSRRRR